jgi:hypothetical protein
VADVSGAGPLLTLAVAEAGQLVTAGPEDDVVHWHCCDANRGLCGDRIVGERYGKDEPVEVTCRTCRAMEDQPCEVTCHPWMRG